MDQKPHDKLYAIRHSLAHVLAQAVEQRFPNVKLAFGPPTDTGFYYDFDFGEAKIGEEDLKDFEKRMRKIIGQAQGFKREDLDFATALARVEEEKDSYKRLNIEKLKNDGVSSFSFYSNGPFRDLCEGPHVANTNELPAKAFKLDRIAGAYWLGNEKNRMLTRIYALAFETPEQLQDFLKRRELAQELDHKKLGKELELFHFDDLVGKGLPLWLPNGTIVRNEIEKYAIEMEFKAGYKRVSTPPVAKQELYLKSKHLPAYEESMFPPIHCHHAETGYEEKFYLRPMNCPHHHLIYSSRKRSYRELPLRLAEYGQCFRYEQSGELSGLLRVRGMTLNDAHLYMRPDQIEGEVTRMLAMYREMYDTFKLKDYLFRLSIRGPEKKDKYIGDEKVWDEAEEFLARILTELKIPYYVGVGEAAFYGPKIDIQFKNLVGREETVSTIQLDFLAAINFELRYTDESGAEASPVVVHRAPLSTHERFVSYLIEYYGGAFPTWLAPIQAVLIPVNPECEAYCHALAQEFLSAMIRVEVDDSNNSFNRKIRTHTMRKVPNLLIIGPKEVAENLVTLRRYGAEGQQKTMPADAYQREILDEIRTRANFREPMGSII